MGFVEMENFSLAYCLETNEAFWFFNERSAVCNTANTGELSSLNSCCGDMDERSTVSSRGIKKSIKHSHKRQVLEDEQQHSSVNY